ncbi:hypothetical protein LguiA_017633 [Lonicera macranthoides]
MKMKMKMKMRTVLAPLGDTIGDSGGVGGGGSGGGRSIESQFTTIITMDSRGDYLLDEEQNPKQEQSSVIGEFETDSISDILSKIPNETLLEIFSHLPPEGVFKIRSISKTWSNLTRQCFFTAKYSRRSKITGFFYQERACINEEYFPDNPLFIPIEPHRNGLQDPHFNFLKRKNRIVSIQIIDSCNGLLLCSGSRMGRFGLVKTWFVCNPVTMEKLALPYPRRRSYKAIYALVADNNSSGYLEFKVLCLFGPNKEDPYSKLSIFSSERGVWEDLEGYLPPVCDDMSSQEVFEFEGWLPPVCDKSLMGSKLFFNGKLLWDCFEGHILKCHLNDKNQKCRYELIEAPHAPLGRCLWAFEDKIRCYCHGFPDFPAWSICPDDYKNKPKWKLEDCEEFENLSEDICKVAKGWVTTKKTIPRIRFKIIAYAPESQKIFLFIPDSIYSYGLRNRNLKLVWACTPSWHKFHSTSRLLPYVHSLAPIQTWKMDKCGSDLVQTVQTEKDNYHNFVELTANNAKPTRSRKTTAWRS